MYIIEWAGEWEWQLAMHALICRKVDNVDITCLSCGWYLMIVTKGRKPTWLPAGSFSDRLIILCGFLSIHYPVSSLPTHRGGIEPFYPLWLPRRWSDRHNGKNVRQLQKCQGWRQKAWENLELGTNCDFLFFFCKNMKGTSVSYSLVDSKYQVMCQE